jgi:hypothetical protein
MVLVYVQRGCDNHHAVVGKSQSSLSDGPFPLSIIVKSTYLACSEATHDSNTCGFPRVAGRQRTYANANHRLAR